MSESSEWNEFTKEELEDISHGLTTAYLGNSELNKKIQSKIDTYCEPDNEFLLETIHESSKILIAAMEKQQNKINELEIKVRRLEINAEQESAYHEIIKKWLRSN